MICPNCLKVLPRWQKREKAKVVKTVQAAGKTLRIYKCPHCHRNFSTTEMPTAQIHRLENISDAARKIAIEFYM